MPVNKMPGIIKPGIKIFQEIVCPKACVSRGGAMRTKPSSHPIYQSGCEPAEICPGVYGP